MDVDQKTNWNIEQPEVGQKLSLVDGAKKILALQFDHDFAFDDNVSTKATVHLYAFINDSERASAVPLEDPVSRVPRRGRLRDWIATARGQASGGS
jgi:hypothetical protein